MSNKQQWVFRWRYWIAPKTTLPGVWRRKEGGFLVRGRATDPRTGKRKEVTKVFEAGSAVEAYEWLQAELLKVRHAAEPQATMSTRQRWSDWAVSYMERRVQLGKMKSAATRIQWGSVLKRHLIPAFGHFWVDELRVSDVQAWQARVSKQIRRPDEKKRRGLYSPHTINDWIAILSEITNAAFRDLERKSPTANLERFDVSEHPTYTEEEPNSLTVEEVRRFLAKMRELFPQHFAMVALGFATGLRPSTLRPLRRGGVTPDVLWDEGVLLVRRSQTRGKEVMNTTKTGLRQRITLPTELIELLRWHEAQLPEGPMLDSELLFPSDTGGFRSSTVLTKPFAAVSKAMKLSKSLSPRGMRRTFQDLARAAAVNDLVTRSVSGHATEEMQRHYSTVNPVEQREALARVVSLAGFKEAQEQVGVKVGVKDVDMKKAR